MTLDYAFNVVHISSLAARVFCNVDSVVFYSLADLSCWPYCMEVVLTANSEIRDAGRGLHVGHQHLALWE